MLTILLVSLALSGATADQRRRAQVKIDNAASLLVYEKMSKDAVVLHYKIKR